MWKRTSAHNTKLITASNALHAFMVFDLRKYRKNGFVEKSRKQKKTSSCHTWQAESLNKLQTSIKRNLRRLYHNALFTRAT